MKDVRRMSKLFLIVAIVALCGFPLAIISQNRDSGRRDHDFDEVIKANSHQLMGQGRKTFRFDTFGDEAFWGDGLKLHQTIAKVSPRTALSVGLKVDSEALPADVIEAIRKGIVDLDDPAVTLVLLRLMLSWGDRFLRSARHDSIDGDSGRVVSLNGR